MHIPTVNELMLGPYSQIAALIPYSNTGKLDIVGHLSYLQYGCDVLDITTIAPRAVEMHKSMALTISPDSSQIARKHPAFPAKGQKWSAS